MHVYSPKVIPTQSQIVVISTLYQTHTNNSTYNTISQTQTKSMQGGSNNTKCTPKFLSLFFLKYPVKKNINKVKLQYAIIDQITRPLTLSIISRL